MWKWLLFSSIIVFSVNLGYKFYNYKQFVSKSQFINAKIIAQYKKKNYWVLKLKNDKIQFYTTTKDDLKDILNYNVEVGVITKNISFLQYLTKFYAPTFRLGLLPQKKYKQFINSQHKDISLSNIFNALFFADSLYYQTRVELSTLGISHLFALSGLHLAIISMVLYLILSPIYNLLMPSYRNRNIDLGVVILSILFMYLYFVDFPPSLVRSFVMEMLLFIFAFYLRDIFSFKLLFFTVWLSLLIFPNFLVNLGFFLSVMGVFLIYLFFKYFKVNFVNGVILLPFYLYFGMFLITHHFFDNFNQYQLLSPFVSILFSVFYPLEIFLHLIGKGGIFDEYLKQYLLLGDKYIQIHISSEIFYLYLILIFMIAFKNDIITKKGLFYGR